MTGEILRLHQFLPASRANGPGVRAVLWVQGCSLGCPGCFNPQTHPFEGGQPASSASLISQIAGLGNQIEGITLSGGEPLQQPRPLVALLKGIRQQTTLSTLLFSGYRLDEVERMPFAQDLLANLDVLIAGRYDASQRLARDLRGSANKTVHFLTSRYTPADLAPIPPAEVFITPEGEILLSGIDPVQWA